MFARRRLERKTSSNVASRILAIVTVLAVALSLGVVSGIAQELGLLRVEASGRIQIEVHDPEGRIVSRNVVQIDGASFDDVDDAITIVIPQRVVGDYLIHMNVDGSAHRLQHFDISVTDDVETILLADYELIVNAPVEPFVIRSTADGIQNVTGGTDEEAGSSSSTIWIIVIAVVVVTAVAAVVFLRSRKKKPQ